MYINQISLHSGEERPGRGAVELDGVSSLAQGRVQGDLRVLRRPGIHQAEAASAVPDADERLRQWRRLSETAAS